MDRSGLLCVRSQTVGRRQVTQTTLRIPIPYLIRRDLACQSVDSEEYADPQLEPHEKYLDDWAQTYNVPDQTRYNLSAILQGLSMDQQVGEQWYNKDCVLWATVQTSDDGMFWSVSLEFVEDGL